MTRLLFNRYKINQRKEKHNTWSLKNAPSDQESNHQANKLSGTQVHGSITLQSSILVFQLVCYY